jgi:NAD(P)-dependent dehydrogenase (short-subunit alcohol dehydrogenase family)
MSERTWFITGISSGFGRLMTEQLIERGDRVAGTVRNLGAIADIQERFGDRLWVDRLDVTDAGGIDRVVNKAFSDLGRIDVVVNNAGYGLFGAAEGFGDDQIVHQIATNLLGPIRVARAALPHLRKQGGGRILVMSTFGGQAALPGGSMYHAGKWGIEGFFDALGKEIASFGIGVTIIEPGSAGTGFRNTAKTHLAPDHEAYKGTPADMIHAVLTSPAMAPKGDPWKMVKAMIDTVDQTPAPVRLVLGSDAFGMIQRSLTDRLALVESQKELAFSMDLG